MSQAFWTRFVGAGAFTVIALLLVYVTGGHSDAALYGLITAAILFPGAYMAMCRSLKVEVLSVPEGGGVAFRNWVGRTTTLGREQVARLVLQPVDVSTASPRPPKWYLFVVDPDGRFRLRVLISVFDATDVHRFVATVGVPVDERVQVVKPLKVRDELPGSFLWYSAHPWLGALLLTPVLIALVVLLAVLFPSHGG